MNLISCDIVYMQQKI